MPANVLLTLEPIVFKAIQNILENNLDMIKDETTEDPELPEHNNIRGKNYYK